MPFVYGDPTASWAVEPSKFQTAEEWQAFFQEQNVHWVVRSPDFPAKIAPALQELEAEGKLIPIAQTEVFDFSGLRLQEDRKSIPIVVFEVRK